MSGRVIDTYGDPLSFAYVYYWLSGARVWRECDEDGRFTDLPDAIGRECFIDYAGFTVGAFTGVEGWIDLVVDADQELPPVVVTPDRSRSSPWLLIGALLLVGGLAAASSD